MDARALRVFLAVVDRGGFRRGAEALRVAQPSVSATITRLERELGTELFARAGRGVVPTEAGRALVGPAREALHAIAVASAEVAAVRELRGGCCEVVATPSQAVDPLAPVVAEFGARHPGVRVLVRAAATGEECREAVRRGAVEIALVARTSPAGSADDLVVVPAGVQRFVVVALPDAGLPHVVGPDDLRGRRLVVGNPGSGMREVAETVGRDSVFAVEVEHREALLPLVLHGAGAAVVAESWRGIAARCGLVVHELDASTVLHLAWVHRPGRLTPAARALLAVAREVTGGGDEPLTRAGAALRSSSPPA